jgi:hypothetical protein
MALLVSIQGVKRESRMARERSEDALTWNVFRALQNTHRLSDWLTSMTGHGQTDPKVHYWSCDQIERGTWRQLEAARCTFNEVTSRGSEPDMIIETDEVDVWVEAKFGSGNDTVPSDEKGAEERYTKGADGWFGMVCRKDFKTLAILERRYELLRLWLLGSHAAHVRARGFVLINLVRDGQALDIEDFASSAFRQDESRHVRRATWEDIVRMLAGDSDERILRLTDYMRTKTLGYDSEGRLLKAFSV